MGNDWLIYFYENDGTRKEVDNIYGMCSGNFNDIWKKFDFDTNQIHGHCGEVIIDYLNKIINNMLKAEVEVYTEKNIISYSESNKSFMWGIGEPNYRRESIVLYQLMYYRSVAEKNYTAYWFGDQCRFKDAYTTSDGIKHEGKPEDSYD